jgi:DNA-directed RNA polymerase subunit omega
MPRSGVKQCAPRVDSCYDTPLSNRPEEIMARVTVEDCLNFCTDQFALVHLSALRYRQLHKGAKPLVPQGDNKLVVHSLREIASGRIRFRENVGDMLLRHRQKLVSQRLRTLSIGDDYSADELT